MLEVTLKLREVDYAAAVDVLTPVLLDKLSGSSNPIASLLRGKARGLPAAAAKAALDVLPKSTRDELAAACLNRYSGEVSQAITSLAAQKNLPLSIESVEVSTSN